MKTRLFFSLVLASILAAAPAFAGVCDLSCASVAGPTSSSSSGVSRGASSEGTGAECPLHAAGPKRPAPAAPSSGPCRGAGAGGRAAILLASSSLPASVATAPGPFLADAAFAFPSSMGSAAGGRREPASVRMPRSSPPSSTLRL